LSDPRRDHPGRFLLGFASGVVVAVAVAALALALTGGLADEALPTDARDVIEENYFRPVESSTLDEASVDGMISELRRRYDDRFSHYFDPKELREFDRANSGRFSGVGLTVTGINAGLRVATVLPDSPAKRADIKPDDVIVGVDGKSIAGIPEEVSVSRIKGPPGTPVTLSIRPGGNGKARAVHLKRATVELPVATGRIERAGPAKVAYEIQRLDRKGAEGLVLDLRGNGGGQLNESVLTASLFLKKGQRVVSTRSRTQGNATYDAVGDPLPSRPIVVLIDNNTASAAEILAAAITEHHVGTTVGSRSFGKGTVQEIIHLDGGGALDLTVGRYFTADGTSLLGKGITPDLRVRADERTKRDDALQKALDVLAEKIAVENR
jgi:carboxyl-terminal processing protease